MLFGRRVKETIRKRQGTFLGMPSEMKLTMPFASGTACFTAAIFLITYFSIQMPTNSITTANSIDNNLPEVDSIRLLTTKKAGNGILSSIRPCINDSTFFHGSDAKQTCAWIASRQDRVLSFCQAETTRSNCPQVCGICCIDSPKFKFKLKRVGIKKSCQWLKRKEVRQERYCDERSIKNACPFSCGDICPNYVPIVSTTKADPSSTCTDNKYYSMSGRKRTCHWMGLDDTRRSFFCQSVEVRNNCPFSCGECCEDDVQYTFAIKRGRQKKCKWLEKKNVRQERYCNLVMDGSAVSAGCPAACGTCKSPYNEASDDDCRDTKSTKAPGKGGKSIKSPKSKNKNAGRKAPKQESKGKGSKYTKSPKTKSPKQGSKGKGRRCTQAPTHTPTNSPISPSMIPSSGPSSMPSTGLSGLPSEIPSIDASISPSDEPPTSVLSSVPSLKPSPGPSVVPSIYPLLSPSTVPSSGPSAPPSLSPSSTPSSIPSLIPSEDPSIEPSLSAMPSFVPSVEKRSTPVKLEITLKGTCACSDDLTDSVVGEVIKVVETNADSDSLEMINDLCICSENFASETFIASGSSALGRKRLRILSCSAEDSVSFFIQARQVVPAADEAFLKSADEVFAIIHTQAEAIATAVAVAQNIPIELDSIRSIEYPSASPSESSLPSMLPSAVPSSVPSLESSLKPSTVPSVSNDPTGLHDTKEPSSSPSEAPVKAPVSPPVSPPTKLPTKSPVQNTSSPTKYPTFEPTPTLRPIVIPTDAPSPPPQDQSLRRIAEQMNQFYDVSRKDELARDRTDLRDMLERNFEHARDVEDILVQHAHSKSDKPKERDRRLLNDLDAGDYFADLPDFVTQADTDPFKCRCVDCDEDKVCGGLWKGNWYPGRGTSTPEADIGTDLQKVHIVVSHCKSSLEWMSDFTKGHAIASIHIISKCGDPVVGAPGGATIEVMPNVGRCDHTYAYYITSHIAQKVLPEDVEDSIVIFLKDDISLNNFHQSGHWNNLGEMIQLASSENGFACGIIPSDVQFGHQNFFLSAYHEVKTLFDFSMENYGRNIKGYASDGVVFTSDHKTLGSWYASLDVQQSPPELVQVCYGGVFAASVSNIMKRDMLVWKAIEKSLSRGNNIQEGHYAERSWAGLLSTPLQPFQVEALFDKADGTYINKSSMHGALLKRPKLYLHIGVAGTSSTDLLAESLVTDIAKLKSDGYNVAVHGKWDGGVYDFPNVDRIGSCMWSDIIKSEFPDHLKEATVCPKNTLLDLSEYMKRSARASKDIVISNPWLSHTGTAVSLGTYFDPVWDVQVVIYYRRYFEWITIKFEEWREEIFEYTLSPRKALIPSTSFRYIDFLREYCKRLFYGKDVNEDGFPVQELDHDTYDTGIVSMQKVERKLYFDQFDPTTNFEVEELTDLQEYTYFVAKQYYNNPRFRHGINIVNYHDIRGPVTNFYCRVLHDARNACKTAIEREESYSKAAEMRTESFAQVDPILPFKPSHALEDIVIAGYTAGRLQFDDTRSKKKFVQQVLLWIKMVHSALQERKLSITDLPVECLYQFEIDRLLEVSLAYEKALLPGFFRSSKGADGLQDEFSQWRFCSVDTAMILNEARWNFLFEAASHYDLPEQPKAYIHIGAPKTGSTSIQDTMAVDKGVLKQDKYFLAVHGQIEKEVGEYIIDNMLVKCDQLGACVWSEEQRQMVVQGSGNKNAGLCPDYLPRTFNAFLSKAIAAKSNIVISNEWLNRPTSESGLLDILDGWDPIVVIYYRRFFDWMISAHYQWHFDISMGTVESLKGKVRLIDFMRMFCGRLFASKVPHSADDSDLSFVDLTDIQEYTYHAWKRYRKVPQFENNIKIVNFHDGHIIKSFYCDVLNAERACELETRRLESKESANTRSKKSTTYVDLAIGLYEKKTVAGGHDEPMTMEMLHAMGDRFQERMAAKGFVEDDLPTECLTKSEETLLLNVSLAYEKILLPESYASGGEDATRGHFFSTLASGKFCSVDLEGMMRDPRWAFLFEDAV